MDKVFECRYCGRKCKSKNSLVNHEIRCKENPQRLICLGNKGRMPEHTKAYYTQPYRQGGVELDITKSQLDAYRKTHQRCEICGKTIEEAVRWNSKYAPKRLCVDHDHNTNKFRGLLCSVCNRQLGWYEKYADQISLYLDKEMVL